MSSFIEDEDDGGYGDDIHCEDCGEPTIDCHCGEHDYPDEPAEHPETRRLRRLAQMEDAADEDRGKIAEEIVREWAGIEERKD